MSKIHGVRYVHENFVGFVQLQGGAEVALCGPGVTRLLRAETCSVGLHQGQRWGALCSPHKHWVGEGGCGGTVLKDQLHSWVNVVESALVDLQGAVFEPVSHSSGYERPTCLWLPTQSIREVLCFNPTCKRGEIMLFYSVICRIKI